VSLLPSSDFLFLLFGENNFEYNFPSDSCEVINLGKIDSLEKMKMIYSVGDLTLTPSLSESFSMVSLESIACGTPVVAFENTGTSSVVRHKITGYLAQKSNIEDLITGINWVCQNKFNSLHLEALNFEESKIVNMFKNLYISEFNTQTL
jgi:glycosyltransferase involved in cell wall biosynthesis